MAEGILGLGSSGAASLNQELIDKLKDAERSARVEPIETSIEDISGEGGESEKIAEIKAKVNQLLETIKPFDLFISGGATAFDQKTANTTGSSVVFDAVDVGSLNEGTTKVHVDQLAQKDVYQTNIFADKTAAISGSASTITLETAGKPVYQSDLTVSADDIVDASGGTLTIDGKDFTLTATTTYSELVALINADDDLSAKITTSGRLEIKNADETSTVSITQTLGSTSLGLSSGAKFSTENVSYEDLADSINKNSKYTATVETVGTNQNRLVIKSSETGLDNAITITQNGVDLGLNEAANHTVTAQNLLAEVDGVAYNTSSNVLIVDGGLKVTAVEVNADNEYSTISVQNDTTQAEPILQEFVNKYNELVALVDIELYSTDSKVEDKATLRTMMDSIKSQLFGSYGENSDLNIFNFGFEVDRYGSLSLNTTTFNEKIEDDLDSLKSLFIGSADEALRGLGTNLKEYVDSLDSFDGLLTSYENNITSRKQTLEEEKEEAIEALDSKYALMAQQFASYSAIITQFENSFSGLKLMIQQSTAG